MLKALQANPSHGPLSLIYTPSKHHVLSTGLVYYVSCLSTQVCLSTFLQESVSADITLSTGLIPRMQREAGSTPPEVFWCLSLYGTTTSGTQQPM